MEGGRAGVAGHVGADCEGGLGTLARGHPLSLFGPLFVRCLPQMAPRLLLHALLTTLSLVAANFSSHVPPLPSSVPASLLSPLLEVGDPLEFVDASQRVLDGIKNADFLGEGGREGEKGCCWEAGHGWKGRSCVR